MDLRWRRIGSRAARRHRDAGVAAIRQRPMDQATVTVISANAEILFMSTPTSSTSCARCPPLPWEPGTRRPTVAS